MGFYTYSRNVYTTKGSETTSEIVWIGDAELGSVNLLVAGDGSSVMTVEVNNMDGRDAALAAAGQAGGWSTHTLVTNPNSHKQVSDFPEGTRWLRTLRSESAMTAVVGFQVRT